MSTKIHPRRRIHVDYKMSIHQKCPQEFILRKCPLEFAHFEKKCPREFIVQEKFPPNVHYLIILKNCEKSFETFPNSQTSLNTQPQKKAGCQQKALLNDGLHQKHLSSLLYSSINTAEQYHTTCYRGLNSFRFYAVLKIIC